MWLQLAKEADDLSPFVSILRYYDRQYSSKLSEVGYEFLVGCLAILSKVKVISAYYDAKKDTTKSQTV